MTMEIDLSDHGYCLLCDNDIPEDAPGYVVSSTLEPTHVVGLICVACGKRFWESVKNKEVRT